MNHSSSNAFTFFAILLAPLLLTSIGFASSDRHGTTGNTGSNGIRERIAFKINKAIAGKDRLLITLDLGDNAFDSNSPESLKNKRIRITLGRESIEGVTNDNAQVKEDHVRIKLVRNGKGMKINVRKGNFRQLLSQIKAGEKHMDTILSVYVLPSAAGSSEGGSGEHEHEEDTPTDSHAHSSRNHPDDHQDDTTAPTDISAGFGAEDQNTPPTVSITHPAEGQAIEEDHITVQYVITGAYHEVDHAHIQLDDHAEIGKHLPVGSYTFHNMTAGVHVVRVNLRHADHSPLTNTTASTEITFVVSPYGHTHTEGNERLYQRNVGLDLLQSKKRIIAKE